MPQNSESANPAPDIESYFSIDHQGAKEHCSHASVALRAGDVAKAETLLLQALRLQPSSMLAYSLLAQLHTSQGNTDLALQCHRGHLPNLLLEKLAVEPSIKTEAEVFSGQVDIPVPPGVARSVIVEAQMVDVPQTAEPIAPHIAFANEPLIRSGRCFVDVINGGLLWHDTRHTVVWNESLIEVPEHTLADRGLVSAFAQRHIAYPIEGRAFLIGARGAHNFYHWMTDIAPKLALLKTAGYQFKSADRFIVPHADSQFSRELLLAFGVSDNQIFASENEFSYVSADRLIVPYLHNKMGLTMGRWLPEAMSTALLGSRPMPQTGKRVFVQRAPGSSDGRQIVNQAESLEILNRLGFECVQAEKLTVVQQAELFSSASVVVAAHGAALSNIMFCQPGTKVIELYGQHLAPCYRAISALCDLQYHRLYCGAECDANSQTESDKRSGNLTVPLDSLEQLLLSGSPLSL